MKSTEKSANRQSGQKTAESKTAADEQAMANQAGSRSSLSAASIPFAIVIALTLLSGIVHGILDGRWASPEDLIAQGARLLEAPAEMDDWILVETRELEESANKMLRCYGSLVRVYQKRGSDTKVTVAILFGPRGPIAVHTPEICYSSTGTRQVGTREEKTVRHGSSRDQFWSVEFAENGSDANMSVWYGWSDGNEWVAAENPRFWMIDKLYKLQIAGPVGRGGLDPCEDFLTQFLPQVNPLLN